MWVGSLGSIYVFTGSPASGTHQSPHRFTVLILVGMQEIQLSEKEPVRHLLLIDKTVWVGSNKISLVDSQTLQPQQGTDPPSQPGPWFDECFRFLETQQCKGY